MGIKAIHIAADNLSAILSALRLMGAVGNPYLGRLLRRLAHQVRRTKIQVYLSWVSSKSNRADTPWRMYEYPDPLTMQAAAWATYAVASNMPNVDRVAMGWPRSGG